MSAMKGLVSPPQEGEPATSQASPFPLNSLARELLKSPEFMSALAKEMERCVYKRDLREWVKDVRDEMKTIKKREIKSA